MRKWVSEFPIGYKQYFSQGFNDNTHFHMKLSLTQTVLPTSLDTLSFNSAQLLYPNTFVSFKRDFAELHLLHIRVISFVPSLIQPWVFQLPSFYLNFSKFITFLLLLSSFPTHLLQNVLSYFWFRFRDCQSHR